MSARNIVGGLAGLAVSAVKLPFTTAEKVLGHGKDVAAGAAETVAPVVKPVTEPVTKAARTTAGKAASKAADRTAEVAEKAADKVERAADKVEQAAEKVDRPVGKPVQAQKKAAAAKKKAPPKKRPPAAGERTVTAADLPLPPNLPDEPPVAIVEQVIAAENTPATGAGRVTQPKPASRDEGHGDAALQRAEVEEIAEEVAEATAAGAVDIETPVGTTGADVGHNPDTAEADLQQPGTEPIVDPATVNAAKSAADTATSASDPDKG